MEIAIILVATVIILCIIAEKFSGKFGMPALLLFMVIGMMFGSDGFFKIPFENYDLAERFCTVSLCFIMFYGGFNTKWKTARPIAHKAVLLSTVGVFLTAVITAFLCVMILGYTWQESFLIGAVLSSTDAASVFAILRRKKLNLKDGTAPLLEMESGSNDPVSYMMTLIGITMLQGKNLAGQATGTIAGLATGNVAAEEAADLVNPQINIGIMMTKQIVFGVLIGLLIAVTVIYILKKTKLVTDGLDTIFMIGAVLGCFGISQILGGNAFLSVYLMGILVGNSQIRNKVVMVSFFDGLTGLAQIFIFFLLGLLAFPHRFSQILLPAFAIMVFLTFIARPVAVFLILLPFKCSIRQCMLVSFAGLRGAASIVFSIMVVAANVDVSYDLYHIVFMVSLFSVSIQGTLLPWAAKKLKMTDDSIDVRKTFNDYCEESALTLMRMYIPKGHNWENRQVKDVSMPTGSLALMLKRGKETMIPKGDTTILSDDTLILSVPAYEPKDQEKLQEIVIDKKHSWCGKRIEELNLPSDTLIALIIRGEQNLIPDGKTVIMEGDTVVTYDNP